MTSRERLQLAIEKSYAQVVRENNLEIIESPKIEILKLALKNPFAFKAKTSVLPEIELSDYQKIASSIKKRKISVKEEETEKTLEWVQRSRAKFTALNREARKEDFVEIEFQSSQIEKGEKKKDAFILGKGHFIPGFEEKLEGMKAGEEKEFSLVIPRDHFMKELAGKEIKFQVKMTSVLKMELPELNDQFVKSLGTFKDLTSLKQSIEEGIKTEKEVKERQRFREEILEKLSNSITWDLPEILIETEKDRLFTDFKESFSKNPKTSFKDYLAKINKSEEEVKDSFLEPAQKNVKTFLILREIAKKEEIEVSDKEVKEEVNKILKRYPDLKTVEKDLDLEKLRQYTKERITNEKVFQLLEELSEK